MELSFMTFKLLVSYIYCSILVMSMTVSTFDEQVLLDFKSRITDDPFQVMSSWNNSLHYCNWTGITCNPSFQRVMILDLRSLKLVGSIPSSIGNLTFLTTINLRNNSFHGEVPMEIGNLLQLQHLNLTWNSFTGTIPANLSYCKELRSLALEYNSLVGKVLPDQFSSLSKLNYLGLGSNNLTGGIPSWIGNFSTLRGLSLAINNLQGPIPRDIGRLSNLQIFQVYGNQLNGTIPQSLFNISSVYYFSVTQNLLYGELPSDIGLTLPNLVVFAGAVNDFTGPIPVSLSNATKLGVLELSQNKLTGNVPTSLGQLQGLYRMNFEINSLGRNTSGDLRFLDFLVNCTSLQVLSFEDNILGGELPKTIGNLSTRLEIFALGYNMIVGSLPTGLENLVNLTLLSLDNNYLRGSVPESLGKLRLLQGLPLNGNKLSGRIPSSIGNLTSLSTLHIEDNELEGNIPPELGQCIRLSRLNLTGNNLVGSIPKELAGLSSLSISLALANNSLTGSLPAEFGKLINLKEMDISHNKLSGEIPSTLSSCVSLERFIANNNLFRGEIPESLQGLRGLEEIDLSHNNISGGIPEFIGKLPYLRKLDLSFNELEGEVPTERIFANETAVSISGNDELCGGPPNYNFPTCPKQKDASSKKHISSRIKVAIIISVAFLFLLLCSFAACYIVIRKSRKRDLTGRSSRERQSDHFDDEEPTLFNDPILTAKITYQDIFKSTNGFSEDNLVGTGSFGSVYRGKFQVFDKVMAVKVLNLQQRGALKSFSDECRALKSIRHRNLLKIIAVCSSIDYQGNDFKCIVFEFMENGSLDDWLHSKGDEQYLNIIQRLNIAIDAASALDYLHNNCQVPIVHCDLKPSNILLDEEMTAHVGDFGLAKFLFKSSWNKHTSIALKGSIGYIPPEYGSGVNVSTLGDVYSFGIMLELCTGRRPTDEIFKDGLNIHQYVKSHLPRRITEIADASLLLAYEEHNIYEDNASDLEEKAILQDDEYISKLNTSTNIQECLISIMKIGLLCSSSSPRDRMPISIALKEIHTIKNLFLESKRIYNSIDRSDGNKLIKLSSSVFY
ncbi:probable LRR receptor-like serine/threonine-protein kinase At3g47570 [Solanum stenotomum]|uniref:probable LRR receptor-like serine/threonine-protein kinase At3g47570 n=1 Tax=Solanum stenotomum TaxID=172797 RepID=UPI0020D17972|nr:probable LRR receptor-like serine/threonine-protein kinase At3g47570 [Solanum stenotomum]